MSKLNYERVHPFGAYDLVHVMNRAERERCDGSTRTHYNARAYHVTDHGRYVGHVLALPSLRRSGGIWHPAPINDHPRDLAGWLYRLVRVLHTVRTCEALDGRIRFEQDPTTRAWQTRGDAARQLRDLADLGFVVRGNHFNDADTIGPVLDSERMT